MRRFQLVDALAWEKSICVPIFESDDESLALALTCPHFLYQTKLEFSAKS